MDDPNDPRLRRLATDMLPALPPDWFLEGLVEPMEARVEPPQSYMPPSSSTSTTISTAPIPAQPAAQHPGDFSWRPDDLPYQQAGSSTLTAASGSEIPQLLDLSWRPTALPVPQTQVQLPALPTTSAGSSMPATAEDMLEFRLRAALQTYQQHQQQGSLPFQFREAPGAADAAWRPAQLPYLMAEQSTGRVTPLVGQVVAPSLSQLPPLPLPPAHFAAPAPAYVMQEEEAPTFGRINFSWAQDDARQDDSISLLMPSNSMAPPEDLLEPEDLEEEDLVTNDEGGSSSLQQPRSTGASSGDVSQLHQGSVDASEGSSGQWATDSPLSAQTGPVHMPKGPTWRVLLSWVLAGQDLSMPSLYKNNKERSVQWLQHLCGDAIPDDGILASKDRAFEALQQLVSNLTAGRASITPAQVASFFQKSLPGATNAASRARNGRYSGYTLSGEFVRFLTANGGPAQFPLAEGLERCQQEAAAWGAKAKSSKSPRSARGFCDKRRKRRRAGIVATIG